MRRTSMNVNDVVTEIKQPNIMSTMVSIYAVSLSVWLIAKTRWSGPVMLELSVLMPALYGFSGLSPRPWRGSYWYWQFQTFWFTY